MENVIERLLYFYVAAYIMIDEAKARIFEKRLDVLLGPGGIIVHAQHFVALIKKAFA